MEEMKPRHADKTLCPDLYLWHYQWPSFAQKIQLELASFIAEINRPDTAVRVVGPI